MGEKIIHSVIFGLMTGFSEFLPVSSLAHQFLYTYFTGFDGNAPLLKLMVYVGCLAALLLSCHNQLTHMQREVRIASLPKSKQKRMPDMVAVLNFRLMLLGMIPAFICLLFSGLAMNYFGKLTWVALMLTISGCLVYLPAFMPIGNRNSKSMGPLDGLTLGLCAGLSVIPGISRMGTVMWAARNRGCSREYSLDLALLYSIPILGGLIFGYILLTISAGAVSAISMICGALAAIASFGGGLAGIYLMRYLAYKMDFSGFSYCCWVIAACCFIYYLII